MPSFFFGRANRWFALARFSLRQLPFVVLSLMLFLGFFITLDHLPSHTLCLFKSIFHFDCPGCGLTRAFLLIPQGQFRQALELNAASVVLYILFLFWWFNLAFQKFSLKYLSGVLVRRFKLMLASAVVSLVSLQWLVKAGLYFSQQDLAGYLSKLMKSPFFWIFVS